MLIKDVKEHYVNVHENFCKFHGRWRRIKSALLRRETFTTVQTHVLARTKPFDIYLFLSTLNCFLLSGGVAKFINVTALKRNSIFVWLRNWISFSKFSRRLQTFSVAKVFEPELLKMVSARLTTTCHNRHIAHNSF